MYICSSIANVFASIRVKYHFGDYRKVGSMADIDPLVIEDIENGGCNIPRSTLEKLCDFYYIGGWRKSLLCTGRAKLKTVMNYGFIKIKFILITNVSVK